MAAFNNFSAFVFGSPLPNTALLQNNAPIAFPTTGIGAFNPLTMKDPYLDRLQLDLIYKF